MILTLPCFEAFAAWRWLNGSTGANSEIGKVGGIRIIQRIRSSLILQIADVDSMTRNRVERIGGVCHGFGMECLAAKCHSGRNRGNSGVHDLFSTCRGVLSACDQRNEQGHGRPAIGTAANRGPASCSSGCTAAVRSAAGGSAAAMFVPGQPAEPCARTRDVRHGRDWFGRGRRDTSETQG